MQRAVTQNESRLCNSAGVQHSQGELAWGSAVGCTVVLLLELLAHAQCLFVDIWKYPALSSGLPVCCVSVLTRLHGKLIPFLRHSDFTCGFVCTVGSVCRPCVNGHCSPAAQHTSARCTWLACCCPSCCPSCCCCCCCCRRTPSRFGGGALATWHSTPIPALAMLALVIPAA